jgi:hypothetical protein
VLRRHRQKSALAWTAIVFLWVGGISGDIFSGLRARRHRGPSHRVTRQLICDSDHATEPESYYLPHDGIASQSETTDSATAVLPEPPPADIQLQDNGMWKARPYIEYTPGDRTPFRSRGPPQFT